MNTQTETKKEFVYVVNFKQACAYIKNRILPVDLIYDENKMRLVFVFKIEDTKEVWAKWKKHEIKF